MTQENLNKIAKRYAQDELKDNHSAVEDVVAAAFLNGIDYAEHHPHWISVEDELPKEDVFVQVVCDDYVIIARRHENRWQLGFDTKTANHLIYTPYNNNITHWMPLPQPPAKLSNVERIGKEGL